MLIEVDSKSYFKHFPIHPHPFVSESFIDLNKAKTEKLVYLIEDIEKPGIGLVAGMKNSVLHSPFSAPFGGFHFRKEIMYIGEIDLFLNSLKNYINLQGLKGIDITLPPDIYHLTFNAKSVNSLFRNKFQQTLPEITNWVNLYQFQGRFTQKNSKEYLKQAIRNELSFESVDKNEDKNEVYELIRLNRAKFDRPIFMSFQDILNTANLWQTDYFKVVTSQNELVASAIFYRSHPNIAYALFWGDNEIGRPLRAMDFLAFNLWNYYKSLDFEYIDLGISTETGMPNEGLLRFKESHEATSSIRNKFTWRT